MGIQCSAARQVMILLLMLLLCVEKIIIVCFEIEKFSKRKAIKLEESSLCFAFFLIPDSYICWRSLHRAEAFCLFPLRSSTYIRVNPAAVPRMFSNLLKRKKEESERLGFFLWKYEILYCGVCSRKANEI